MNNSLTPIIKEKVSKLQKLTTELIKEKSKLNAVPIDDELVSTFTEIPESTNWPSELIEQ